MIKQVIVMRTDLGMNTGKMCAQAAHAAMLFMNTVKYPSEIERVWLWKKTDIPGWEYGMMTKIVVKVDSLEKLEEIEKQGMEKGLIVHKVIDATLRVPTCIAIGPDEAEKIDEVTGGLELLK